MNKSEALKISDSIKPTIKDVITYSQKAYPNEACGFILEGGIIFPAKNIIGDLKIPSLTAKTAFLLDTDSWSAVSNRIVGIYHSHTNGNPEMSSMDTTYLKWPELCYLVLGILDYNPVAAKLYWWEDSKLCQIDVKL